jgi:hypothetical protein
MERESESWIAWPVSWSAVWVGTLAALAVGLIIGLIGFAVGAHETSRFVDWKKVRLIGLVFSVAGAFFAFVVGAWVAARVAGIRRSEPAILHGAIVWMLALPILLVLAALGTTAHYGGWYGGLSGNPVWATAVPPVDPEIAKGMRNTATATVTALLIGLMGAVIGGWMASGEPMTFGYHKVRHLETRRRESDPVRTHR